MIQNKQTATELFIIQPKAGARSPQRALKATHRDQELKDALRKKRQRNMYKEYLHTLMSKYCSNVVLLLYCIFNSSFIFKMLHRAVFLRVGEMPLFRLK